METIAKTAAKAIARYVPAGYAQIFVAPSLGIEAYADPERKIIIAYSGKRTKKDFFMRFRSPDFALAYMQQWYEGIARRADEKEAEQARKRAYVSDLVVGDIFCSTWGYDQTNVDFYEVVATIGKCTVELREIGQLREHTGDMTGNCVPTPGKFIGPVTRHRVINGRVKIDSHSAEKIEPIIVAGIKTFKPHSWSSYH